MSFLESNRGNVASREDIARNVWPELPAGRETNEMMDQAIGRLRVELGDDPAKPKQLLTVGEFGFMLL
jgi:DNA-binding response OmpR family regulator